ncbi:hypothetical protein DEFDS_P193 (plasmid) [Deferribacter desulfuricans SSM1]|uniref:Uncharacterized protein n=1 Tax=Deferribacter desulfuricans (strain DSM 14783 / JCM 11476 / NBRC 101012 / SSM1) TaxID=639282 RepID=D3PF21_DEFDS|nr:hypothetical protein [Deferribacter desulfuricans]BAI81813.1 hypothetical protein DEFDS_P193 [Deferribacter desulfuricans SSM1]
MNFKVFNRSKNKLLGTDILNQIITKINENYVAYTRLKELPKKEHSVKEKIQLHLNNVKFLVNGLHVYSIINYRLPQSHYNELIKLIESTKDIETKFSELKLLYDRVVKTNNIRLNSGEALKENEVLTNFKKLHNYISDEFQKFLEFTRAIRKAEENIRFNLKIQSSIKDKILNKLNLTKKYALYNLTYALFEYQFFNYNNPYKNYLNKDALKEMHKYLHLVVEYYGLQNYSPEIKEKLNNLKLLFNNSKEYHYVVNYCKMISRYIRNITYADQLGLTDWKLKHTVDLMEQTILNSINSFYNDIENSRENLNKNINVAAAKLDNDFEMLM